MENNSPFWWQGWGLVRVEQPNLLGQVVCFTLNITNWQGEVYISELALVSKANYSVPPGCGAGHDIIYYYIIIHILTHHIKHVAGPSLSVG